MKEEAASVDEGADLGKMNRERCIKRLVRTVVKKQKYPSSHLRIDRYTARNATRNTNQRDIKQNGCRHIITLDFLVIP